MKKIYSSILLVYFQKVKRVCNKTNLRLLSVFLLFGFIIPRVFVVIALEYVRILIISQFTSVFYAKVQVLYYFFILQEKSAVSDPFLFLPMKFTVNKEVVPFLSEFSIIINVRCKSFFENYVDLVFC